MKPLKVAFYLALAGLLLWIVYLGRLVPMHYTLASLGILAAGAKGRLSLRTQVLIATPFLILALTHADLNELIPNLMGMLLVIGALKLSGDYRVRDLLQVYLLNLLAAVGAAVMVVDISYAAVFTAEALACVCGLMMLYGATESHSIPLRTALSLTGFGVAGTTAMVAITAFYFITLPRPQFTVFASPYGVAKTGLTDRVAPGNVSALLEDNDVAFRVVWIKGKRPPQPRFRVFVYKSYSNGVWRATRRRITPVPKDTDFTVEVLPSIGTTGIPLPGYAIQVKRVKGPVAYIAEGGTIALSQETTGPAAYRVGGSFSVGVDEPPEEYLSLPKNLKMALMPIAQRLKGKNPQETVRRVLEFLRDNYTYTLHPGRPEGEPTLWFLFKGKRGHCEYFASAAVLILRSLGIPARVVGGYAGGEWNPLGHYYILRQSHAHAWVEAYLPQRGWVELDPTPSNVSARAATRPKRPSRISLLIDYLQLKWYYWVIEYDFLKQKRLFLKAKSFALKPKVPPAKVVGWTTAALILVLLLHRALKGTGTEVRRPVNRLIALLEKRGFEKRPNQTLKEYLSEVWCSLPHLESNLKKFLELYYAHAYGGVNNLEEQERVLRDIRRKLPQSQHLTN